MAGVEVELSARAFARTIVASINATIRNSKDNEQDLTCMRTE